MIFLYYYIYFFIFNNKILCNHKHNNILSIQQPNIMMKNQEYVVNDNYKKIIKKSNIFSKIDKVDSFNYINNTLEQTLMIRASLYKLLASYNFSFDFDFNKEPQYDKVGERNIGSEILFLLNKNTKVYIHIEQLFARTNIYHIAVSFRSITDKIRYDLVGINIDNLRTNDQEFITLFWGYSNKTIDEIVEYENSMEYRYILGIYDCRHYVRNLTKWSTNKSTPVWSLDRLVK